MGLSTVDAFKHIQSKEALTLSEQQLKNLQKTLNGMLADFAECCRRHGLSFVLGGGSCLGAVRHHGFIPWDDDVDVNMPRKDFEQFVLFFEQEYGDRYWIHTPQATEGYGLTLSRILLKGTSVKTREDFHNRECGAFLDIFLIENTYDSAFLRRLHGLECMAAGFAQSCAKFRRDGKELMALVDSIEDGKERAHYRRVFAIKIALGHLFFWRSLDGWTKRCDRAYGRCRNENSVYVTMPSGRGHFFRELYQRDQIFPAKNMPYEDTGYPVPADYEGYLTRLYGNFREIPSEAHREKHIFFAPFVLPENGSDGASLHQENKV